MSPYYDSELSPDVASSVQKHLDVCNDCRAELHAFRELSRMAAALSTPPAPDVWPHVDAQLDAQPAIAPISPLLPRKTRRPLSGLVAIITVAIAVAFAGVVLFSRHTHGSTGAFDVFLKKLGETPEAAEHVLADAYNGRSVTLVEAENLLNYRPIVAKGLPDGYKLTSAYVIRMPCCTCFQANLRRSDGGRVVLFEHDGGHTEWFGDRRAIRVNSQAGPTSLVQAEDLLAATCTTNSHYLTVVGRLELSEVDRLLGFCTKPEPK
jgi:hypothetical protein